MRVLTLLDRHAGLVGRMANALGIDLAEAAQRGEMPEEGIRSAVYSCTACTHTGDCEGWLDAHEKGAAETPDYCRNKALFDRLAEQ